MFHPYIVYICMCIYNMYVLVLKFLYFWDIKYALRWKNEKNYIFHAVVSYNPLIQLLKCKTVMDF